MGNVWHLQSWGDIAFPSSFFLNSSFIGFFSPTFTRRKQELLFGNG